MFLIFKHDVIISIAINKDFFEILAVFSEKFLVWVKLVWYI